MEIVGTKQKLNEKTWTDEAGNKIPVRYLKDLEKMKESKAMELLTSAIKMHNELLKFKEVVAKVCQDIMNAANIENKAIGKGKGNFTWYNFDRSIRVEVRIHSIRTFDDLTIMAAKEKLEECIKQEGTAASDFINNIVIDAFAKKSGKMDVDKVLSLKKHKDRTKNPLFHEAMELIDKAIRITNSKTYHSISQRMADGSYENVNLDFASL